MSFDVICGAETCTNNYKGYCDRAHESDSSIELSLAYIPVVYSDGDSTTPLLACANYNKRKEEG